MFTNNISLIISGNIQIQGKGNNYIFRYGSSDALTIRDITLQANTTAIMAAERVTFSAWTFSHYLAFIEDIGKKH